jgi:trans-aconitate methyltransferase
VVDVASGAGAFLSVLLDAFPEARGVWTDASPAMLDRARVALDHLDGYRAAGLTDVDVAWKAFYSCLFVGRSDSADTTDR